MPFVAESSRAFYLSRFNLILFLEFMLKRLTLGLFYMRHIPSRAFYLGLQFRHLLTGTHFMTLSMRESSISTVILLVGIDARVSCFCVWSFRKFDL